VKGAMTSHRINGSFEVELTPQTASDAMTSAALGRLGIDKQFHGDLKAHSVGEMLSALTDVPGSAGYVALERVTGTLVGRQGSFVLQHSGTMTREERQLSVTVVPDSGTDALTGLTGRMHIQNADGQHAYTFEFTLPEDI
jgi:predicted flavoprotein YhiN